MIDNNNNNKNNYYPKNKNIKPQIYAYTVPAYKEKGFIKVGFTVREDPEDRIKEQVLNINIGKNIKKNNIYEILGTWDSFYENKKNVYFRDKDVHKVLKKLGCQPDLDSNGRETEWFKCSLDEVKTAITSVKEERNDLTKERHIVFGLRPEQEDAVNKTANFFLNYKKTNNEVPSFLWNAKMRFGKTFTTYKLAEKMGWKNILILTFKPAVQSSWKNDLESHIDFKDWVFKESKNNQNLVKEDFNKEKPVVCFSSFQDILGEDGNKEKFDLFYQVDWDCIVFDEYHFGSWRDRAKSILETDEINEDIVKEDITIAKTLKSKHYLYLSGTPFRSLTNGEFMEEQIFNWTYSNEQKAKTEWNNLDKENPYSDLPQVIMMTYEMPDYIRKEIDAGNNEDKDGFNLNEFFKVKDLEKDDYEKSEFLYKKEVKQWLFMILGEGYKNQFADSLKEEKSEKPPLPFNEADLREYLKHTFWLLPSVNSCYAMRNLIAELDSFKNYTVIVAAGNKIGIGEEAFKNVYNIINQENPLNHKTITLSCGKLSTGVSMPAWTGIFMLSNLTSPETYFQTAFRVQTPWVIYGEDGTKEIVKDKCYVFDFSPKRALTLVADYCYKLDAQTERKTEEKIQEFVNFMPILAYDGYSMKRLDASSLLELASSGTTSTMLARKFQSLQLVTLNYEAIEALSNNENLLNNLNKIEAFRNLNQDNNMLDIIISDEKALKDKKLKPEKTKEDKKEIKDLEEKIDVSKNKIRELLLKFLTRIPVFMYLTDDREETVLNLIRGTEKSLFIKTTGITIEDFEQLCKIKIFNEQKLDYAILAFRRFEDSSLNYAGNSKQDLENRKITGGFDNVYDKEDEELIINKNSRVK